MKVTNLLLASLASVALMSCSQADSLKENTSGAEKDVAMKFEFKGMQRAQVGKVVPDKAVSLLDTAQVFFTKGGNVDQIPEITPVILDALKVTDKGYVFERIGETVDGVGVVINGKSALAKGAKFDTDKPGDILPLKFTEIQPKGQNGVDNAPMIGVGTAFAKEGVSTTTGNDIMKTSVTVKPIIARVQVSGKIATNPHKVALLKVTRLFVDNFYTSNTKTDKFTVEKRKDAELAKYINGSEYAKIFDYADPKGQTDLQGKNGKNGVYTYHIFPQKVDDKAKKRYRCVNLIIEYQYQFKKPDGTLEPEGLGYATLSFATPTGNKEKVDLSKETPIVGIKEIQAGKIYNIDLSKIDWNPDGKYTPPIDKDNPQPDADVFPPKSGPDPYPYFGNVDVHVLVSPSEWTYETIIPSF